MTIGLEMHEDVAVFTWPPGYDRVVDEFDELLDRRDTGRLSRARYRKALGELVERNPWFIDGHAHLGYAAYERGEFESALDACERGYSLGLQAMPAGFEQFIEWGLCAVERHHSPAGANPARLTVVPAGSNRSG